MDEKRKEFCKTNKEMFQATPRLVNLEQILRERRASPSPSPSAISSARRSSNNSSQQLQLNNLISRSLMMRRQVMRLTLILLIQNIKTVKMSKTG